MTFNFELKSELKIEGFLFTSILLCEVVRFLIFTILCKSFTFLNLTKWSYL